MTVPLLLQTPAVFLIKSADASLPGIGEVMFLISFLASPAVGFLFVKRGLTQGATVVAALLYLPLMLVTVVLLSLEIVGRFYGLSL